MKIQDLIALTQYKDDKQRLALLKQFISSLPQNDHTLTPGEILQLTIKLQVFMRNENSLSITEAKSILLKQLQYLIITQISPQLIQQEIDLENESNDQLQIINIQSLMKKQNGFRLKNAILSMIEAQTHNVFDNKENFFCLLGKGDSAFKALDFFKDLADKNLLDNNIRNSIIVSLQQHEDNATIIRCILFSPILTVMLNKAIVESVFTHSNEWRQYHTDFVFYQLHKLGLIPKYQACILQNIKQGTDIGNWIETLCKTAYWEELKVSLLTNPKSAYGILEKTYGDYKNQRYAQQKGACPDASPDQLDRLWAQHLEMLKIHEVYGQRASAAIENKYDVVDVPILTHQQNNEEKRNSSHSPLQRLSLMALQSNEDKNVSTTQSCLPKVSKKRCILM